jgi:hypothetical protein
MTLGTPRELKVGPPVRDQPAIPYFRYASVRIQVGCQGGDRKWSTCSQIDANDPIQSFLVMAPRSPVKPFTPQPAKPIYGLP